MDGVSLKSRAVVFATCAGLVAFFLALLVTTGAVGWANLGWPNYARALIPAIVCGTMCWASAARSIATTAEALDAAIARLAEAGEGDLDSPLPPAVDEAVPQLARAMQALFRRLRANLDSIERMAMFDTVTGLPNRSNFRAKVETALAAMPGDVPAALLFIDLDRFKAVNDTRGHAAGDQLLGQVAGRLRGVAREGGGAGALVGRLAGDEFTLFLPGADAASAGAAAQAILDRLAEPFAVGGATLQIGASVGVAMTPAHGRGLQELMRAADTAMYHAKAGGRGRAEFFSDLLAARIADRAQLDAELRDAVDQGQFALVFQPQVSLADGRLVAAEALLRWRHPTQGLRLPGSFIERAEETGLIVAIGEAVVDEIARALARWGTLGHDGRLAINLSRRQLEDPRFCRALSRAIRAAGAPARLLEVEISETLAATCGPEAFAAVAGLRGEGARVSIDQFGTGQSNLMRLRDLPVDRYKLDRSVTARIVEDGRARAIAQAMIGVAHGLGCEAVAEGVESAEQADILRVIGCDTVQGHAVAPPMDEESFLAWAARPVAMAS